jgi:hypothetical protein
LGLCQSFRRYPSVSEYPGIQVTTDIDGTPILMLNPKQVRSLLEQKPSPELVARMDNFLAEADSLDVLRKAHTVNEDGERLM